MRKERGKLEEVYTAQYYTFYVAEKYENGEGVAKNLDEARKWYQLAAAQGDKDAQEALTHLK